MTHVITVGAADHPKLVTAVIGAGPAGLLFCTAARIMFEGRKGDPSQWAILLFDKRAEYVRSHRLRIAPRPLLELQSELDDRRFDELINFLKSRSFSPAVNELEQHLASLVAALGMRKELLHVGPKDGQLSLPSLRSYLEDQYRLEHGFRLTIVAADSAHSTVRETIRGGIRSIERTHQVVARIKIIGTRLPESLGTVDRYRVSKVLGSIVDYRLNPNGFAEVDVFLPAAHHRRLERLGASPSQPVSMTPELVRSLNAPLFGRLIEYFRDGLTGTRTDVQLQSTFRLEHRYVERVTYADPSQNAHIFLVGDAAISLPFFRGMASTVKCVHSLVRVHCALVDSQGGIGDAAARYEREVAVIRKRELAIVNARARLVRGAKEFARVSSLIPFPLQTWFLSIPQPKRLRGRMTGGVVLNALIAIFAGGCALIGLAVAMPVLWIGLIAQLIGGLTYRAAVELEPPPDTLHRRIWLVQIVALLAVGVSMTIAYSINRGEVSMPFASVLWLALGYVFIVGMVLYEALGRRWFATAELEGDQPVEL